MTVYSYESGCSEQVWINVRVVPQDDVLAGRLEAMLLPANSRLKDRRHAQTRRQSVPGAKWPSRPTEGKTEFSLRLSQTSYSIRSELIGSHLHVWVAYFDATCHGGEPTFSNKHRVFSREPVFSLRSHANVTQQVKRPDSLIRLSCGTCAKGQPACGQG
jgi:hypothetical protein